MDYAWVDNKVSSGTGWQVRKEENQVQSCPHSELTEFVLMIIVSLTPMTLAGVFYRKSSFSGHSCSFQFHTFTHIHTHARGSARTSYIFSSVSLWLRTHTHTHTHTEPCDTWYAPFGCCMYFLWKRRALEALSFVKVCVGVKDRENSQPPLWCSVVW